MRFHRFAILPAAVTLFSLGLDGYFIGTGVTEIIANEEQKHKLSNMHQYLNAEMDAKRKKQGGTDFEGLSVKLDRVAEENDAADAELDKYVRLIVSNEKGDVVKMRITRDQYPDSVVAIYKLGLAAMQTETAV